MARNVPQVLDQRRHLGSISSGYDTEVGRSSPTDVAPGPHPPARTQVQYLARTDACAVDPFEARAARAHLRTARGFAALADKEV